MIWGDKHKLQNWWTGVVKELLKARVILDENVRTNADYVQWQHPVCEGGIAVGGVSLT